MCSICMVRSYALCALFVGLPFSGSVYVWRLHFSVYNGRAHNITHRVHGHAIYMHRNPFLVRVGNAFKDLYRILKECSSLMFLIHHSVY